MPLGELQQSNALSYEDIELTTEGESITEGIGQIRVTKNLEGTPIDAAYQITDKQALPVLFELIEREASSAPCDLPATLVQAKLS